MAMQLATELERAPWETRLELLWGLRWLGLWLGWKWRVTLLAVRWWVTPWGKR